MGDKVLLTDRRNELLEGEYDPTDSTDRATLSRFRSSTGTVVDELLQIAKSPHIDHSKMFDPDDIALLVAFLLTPPAEHTEGGGLVQAPKIGDKNDKNDADDDLPTVEISDEFEQYQNALIAELSKRLLAEYHTE